MTMFIINPGSGPVDDTTEQNAIKNIEQFIKDCLDKDLKYVRASKYDKDGRYGFLVYCEDSNIFHIVRMPGCVLEKMRGNGVNGPRILLEIYGNSWYWEFAVFKYKTDFHPFIDWDKEEES